MFFIQANEIVQAVEALEASEQENASSNQEVKTLDVKALVEKSESCVTLNQNFSPISAENCIFNLPQDEVIHLVEMIETSDFGDIQVCKFGIAPNYSDDPSTSKATFCKTEFYIGDLPVFLSANIRDLSSLNENEWVAETVINDWAHYLIKKFDKSNSILYVPANLYRCFMGDQLDAEKAEKIIKFLVNNRTMEKDIILVCIPAEGDDKHLMLGIIYLNTKRITILDPKQVDDYTSRQHFDYLHRIVAVAHKAYGLKFKKHKWECYFPKRISRQSNEFDCGVFVCSYIHRVVVNMKMQDSRIQDTIEGRRRIRYVLSNCVTIEPPAQEDICTPFMVDWLSASLSESIYVEKFNIEDFENYRRNRSKPQHAIAKCHDRFCFWLVSDPDPDQFFCLGCRNWYHKKCVFYDNSSLDYSACSDCKINES